MSSIKNYEEIIKTIHVRNHSVIVRKENWIKNDSLHTRLTKNNQFQNNNKDLLNTLKAIFENAPNGQIEISREDIFKEEDREKKLIMVLLWGYPTGGRGNNIANILNERKQFIEKLKNTLKDKKNSIAQDDYKKLKFKDENTKKLKFKGLGLSTMSKILYFFEVKIDNNPCLIFDTQILLSLQKNNIDEFKNVDWEQKEEKYFEYLEIVNTISKEKLNNPKIKPEAIELFLFHYNMHFKLD